MCRSRASRAIPSSSPNRGPEQSRAGPPWPRRLVTRQYGRVAPDAETPEEFFRSRGFDVQIEERDLHAEYMAAGQPGRASFFAPDQRYACVQLLRDGKVVVRNYAHGKTAAEALNIARRRYGSEQGSRA